MKELTAGKMKINKHRVLQHGGCQVHDLLDGGNSGKTLDDLLGDGGDLKRTENVLFHLNTQSRGILILTQFYKVAEARREIPACVI